MPRWYRQLTELKRFLRQAPTWREIVFYSEDAASWVHLGPVVEQLIGVHSQQVSYLTSQIDDPILNRSDPSLATFYVGDGAVRTAFFMLLNAKVLVMTMPDLHTYHIKRSMMQPVHYVYIFHSMVSTHMTYRKGAFDHFDTILCVGPHHIEEIRATERVHELSEKQLLQHGYGRLDALLSDRGDVDASDRTSRDVPCVVLAPSWGPNAILESVGREVISILLDANFDLIVRPHPMTVRHQGALIKALRREFDSHSKFALETDVSSSKSIHESDVMISDWSGVALEYAFVHERPVLFIDMPRKVNNPDYEQIGHEPWEVQIRHKIGDVLPIEALHELPQRVQSLHHNQSIRAEIGSLRDQMVFHIGHSGEVGAQHVLDVLEDLG